MAFPRRPQTAGAAFAPSWSFVAALAAALGACAAPSPTGGGYVEPQPDVTANFGDTTLASGDGAAGQSTASDTGQVADAKALDGAGAGGQDAGVSDAPSDLSVPPDVADASATDALGSPDAPGTADVASAPDSDADISEAQVADTQGDDDAPDGDAGPNDAADAGDALSPDADAQDAATDAGPGPTDATTTGLPGPAAGELVITELHVNPAVVADADGEWFEVCNVTGKSLSLAGVILGDGTAVSDPTKAHAVFVGETLTIPAGGCFVFGAKAATASNGGVDAGYSYNGAFTLNNTGTETVFLRVGATTIDTVSYSPKVNGWPAMPNGATYALAADKTSASANDNGAHWCVTATPKFGAGDFGTPGKPNGACP